MPRRRGSAASAAHAERMRALLAAPALPFETVVGGESDAAAPRGRGRPPGSRNWVDGQLEKYLAARGYIHPAIGWAEICSRPIKSIARELGIKGDKAAAIWLRASELLAPHIAQKLPIAVQIDQRGDFTLQIEGLSSAAAMPIAGAEGVTIEGAALPIADDEKSKA